MSFPIDSDTMGVKLSSVPYLFVRPRVQDLRSLLHKSLCRYPSPLQFFSGSVVLLHVQSLQSFPLAANFILVRLCSVGPFCYRNSAFAYIGPVHYLARWSLGYVKLFFFGVLWCLLFCFLRLLCLSPISLDLSKLCLIFFLSWLFSSSVMIDLSFQSAWLFQLQSEAFSTLIFFPFWVILWGT